MELKSDLWQRKTIDQIATILGGGTPSTNVKQYWNGDINWFTPTEVGYSKYVNASTRRITGEGLKNSSAKLLPVGSILLTTRAGIGDLGILTIEACTNQGFQSFIPKDGNDGEFLYYLLSTLKSIFLKNASGSTFLEISPGKLKCIEVLVPSHKEQTAIATALADTDALITSLEKLIAKKRSIKQGAMQELLKPKKGWEEKRLGEIVDVLDNLRRPLNDAARQKMKGDIPYCGANGVVGYVDDYLIDDDIILMAEDGGYFDEYKTRAIAYKMQGKCWVNNHAHILKSKKGINQDFVFYSIVHKNILDFVNGGTRAKLNKGELLNIPIQITPRKNEQDEVAEILLEMDSEIIRLESKLEKYRQIKSGMMQNLLTGKIRLV